VVWIVEGFASGIWWDDHGFGYRAGTNWKIPMSAYFLVVWLVCMMRLSVRERRLRGTRVGHALLARMWAAIALVLLGAAIVLTPRQGAHFMLAFAVLATYRTWTEAVRHHLPARIVLGPGWWIHRWAADAEHGR
jgi:hypothetical protein